MAITLKSNHSVCFPYAATLNVKRFVEIALFPAIALSSLSSHCIAKWEYFSLASRPPNLGPVNIWQHPPPPYPQTSEQLHPEVTGTSPLFTLMPPPAESATGSKVSRPCLSASQPPRAHSFLSLPSPHGHSREMRYPHSCSYQNQQVQCLWVFTAHFWQWQMDLIK